MNRIDRLFGILTLLQSKKFVPAEKIAERFQISVRTVYRDVKALCEQGIPVSFEPQKGYFIVQGYFLSPVSFTTEEANAFLLMENLVAGFADKSIKKHYATALSKVKSVLRGVQKDHVEQLSSSIRFQVPECFSHDYEYLSVIQTAIFSKKMLEIEYENNRQEASTRRVEPIGLIFYAFNWHLIAWCHLRGEYRDFKVGRIQKLVSLDVPFSINKHMEIGEFMKLLPVPY